MPTQCDYCPIREGCDFLSGLCRLTPRQVARFRPDLILTQTGKAAAQRRWRAKHLDHCLEYDRNRYTENRDSEIARQIAYQKANPEVRAKAQRNYAVKHKDEINERRRINRANAARERQAEMLV